MRYFTAIDFDGTITGIDVVDSIIEKFAEPGLRIPAKPTICSGHVDHLRSHLYTGHS